MKPRYDILTFHPRRHHNFEQAAGLEKEFASFRHATGLFFPPRAVELARRVSLGLGKELARRSYLFQRPDLVESHPWPELRRLAAQALGRGIDYHAHHEAFGRWVVRHFEPPKIALGFDSLSRRVFRAWKGKSFLVLDLVIGIPQYRAMLDYGPGFRPEHLLLRSAKDQQNYAIYQEEIELADLVLCGSDFVRHTCLTFGVPEEKLVVLNYGVDVERFKNPGKRHKAAGEKLKFVFIGAVGYRKGADVLAQAWQRFAAREPGHELHFFGKVELDFPPDLPGVFFHGHLNQLDLIEHLRGADVMVFPSTFEGSAYSLYQAMAMKLAVITTYNSGTVLRDQESALIVPIGQPEALAEALESLARDPATRVRLAEAAYQQAQVYTWDNYGAKLAALFREILGRV